MKKPVKNGQKEKEKKIMTILEQRYLEVMPMYMKVIAESMKVIADSLSKKNEDDEKKDENPL